MLELAPSLLSADFYDLKSSLNPLVKKNVNILHLDIMDGHYVPNITFGPGLISKLRPHYDFVFDTHLMVDDPDSLLESFAQAGSDIITVHYEASRHIHRTLQNIRALGKKAGLSLNPGTPLDALDYLLPDIDLLLIMSVNPGFGGHSFFPQILEKTREAKKRIEESGYDIILEVDGGIKTENVRGIIQAGANYIVAGSDVFGAKNVEKRIQEYHEIFKEF